jgi:hypothetical protein
MDPPSVGSVPVSAQGSAICDSTGLLKENGDLITITTFP